MAFIGNAQLVIFEIGLVGFVGLFLPELVWKFFVPTYDFASAASKIAWSPPDWLFYMARLALYLLMALAVFRIQTYGDWVTGVNVTALALFWTLQFTLLLAMVLVRTSLWAAFAFVAASLVLAGVTTWSFFQVESALGAEVWAGIFMLVVDVALLPIIIWAGMAAYRYVGRRAAEECIESYMRGQATLGGVIGAADNLRQRPASTTATAAAAIHTQQQQQQQQQQQPLRKSASAAHKQALSTANIVAATSSVAIPAPRVAAAAAMAARDPHSPPPQNPLAAALFEL